MWRSNRQTKRTNRSRQNSSDATTSGANLFSLMENYKGLGLLYLENDETKKPGVCVAHHFFRYCGKLYGF